jgi:membrane fusion protein (multidrug efflux system)
MASVKDIQNKYFVFVLADSNKVAMTPIEVGGHDGNNYILNGGLNNGAKIAINRIDVLNDGMVVKPIMIPADSVLHK